MPATSILITGFQPFAKLERNPSAEIIATLRDQFDPREIAAAVLPVEYQKSQERMDQLIAEHNPAVWLGFGLNQRATAILLEQTALNWDDASLADNAGAIRRSQLIDPAGPEHYRSTLPLEAMAAELTRSQIPVTFSDSAGCFVCNHVFYHTLNRFRQKKSLAIGGFIHIPWPSDWDVLPGNRHSITFLTTVCAAKACVDVVLQDLHAQNPSAT